MALCKVESLAPSWVSVQEPEPDSVKGPALCPRPHSLFLLVVQVPALPVCFSCHHHPDSPVTLPSQSLLSPPGPLWKLSSYFLRTLSRPARVLGCLSTGLTQTPCSGSFDITWQHS